MSRGGVWGCTELVGPFCLFPEVRGMKADLVLTSYGPPQGVPKSPLFSVTVVVIDPTREMPDNPSLTPVVFGSVPGRKAISLGLDLGFGLVGREQFLGEARPKSLGGNPVEAAKGGNSERHLVLKVEAKALVESSWEDSSSSLVFPIIAVALEELFDKEVY